MRSYLPLALWAVPAAAAAAASGVPLQALTEADVGADALRKSACYANDGPSVLVVATKKNAAVNSGGDLLLLDRLDDDGSPHGGARYGSNSFQVVIAPMPEPADGVGPDGRTNRSAKISVRQGGATSSITARWNCRPKRT